MYWSTISHGSVSSCSAGGKNGCFSLPLPCFPSNLSFVVLLLFCPTKTEAEEEELAVETEEGDGTPTRINIRDTVKIAVQPNKDTPISRTGRIDGIGNILVVAPAVPSTTTSVRRCCEGRCSFILVLVKWCTVDHGKKEGNCYNRLD